MKTLPYGELMLRSAGSNKLASNLGSLPVFSFL